MASELYPRAQQVLAEDANLLSLVNSMILLHSSFAGPPEKLAEYYDHLMTLMRAIHGPDETRKLMPEYAMQLAAAKRHADTENVIEQYADEAQGRKLDEVESIRLTRAVDKMAGWGVSHRKAYEKLRQIWEAGHVTDSFEQNADAELATDQEKLSGVWVAKRGTLAVTMTVEGDHLLIEVLGPKGNVVDRHTARFLLRRSGACRLLHRYPVNARPENGDAMIYKLTEDELFVTRGMLHGPLNGSNPDFTVWKRRQTEN